MGTSVAAVPRWEWRTFARTLPISEGMLAELTQGEPTTSRETYLLSLASPHNVKVRGATLDIKRLTSVDTDGLELWRPVFKATLPVNRDAIEAAYAAWAIPVPHLGQDRYDLEAIRQELVAPDPRLRAVDLTKRRTRLTLHGCPGERVTLEVEGRAWDGLSLEHEDPAALLAALTTLGLDGRTNTNYPRALKRMLGLPAEFTQSVHGVPCP